MSDAGGAQKRPALRGGPSLARGGVAPRSQSPARLPRRALPRSQIWASQLSRLFRDGPFHPNDGEQMITGKIVSRQYSSMGEVGKAWP